MSWGVPGAAGAALLPELGERRAAPGDVLEVPIVAGEPGASVFIERAPGGVALTADGPGRWTLRWTVPSRMAERTVIRLGASDRRDRTRRESRELIVLSGPGEASDAPAAPARAAANADAPKVDGAISPLPPLSLVAGRAWALSLPVGETDAAPGGAALELRGAPVGLTATSDGRGWYTLRWRPGPEVAGNWTVELVATDARDPTRQARRRLALEVRSPLVEVRAAVRDPSVGEIGPAPDAPPPPTSDPEPPALGELPNHVVNPGQDVTFRVGTLGDEPARLDIDRLPRGARFDDNGDGTRTFYWPTSDRDQGEHRFRFKATDARDPSLTDSADVLVIVGDPSRGRTVPAGDRISDTPTR